MPSEASEASEADAIPSPKEGPMKPCFCFEIKLQVFHDSHVRPRKALLMSLMTTWDATVLHAIKNVVRSSFKHFAISTVLVQT